MTKFEDAVKALADQRREHFLTCKPSELIMLALEDLEKVEAQKDVYRVDMGVFHSPLGEDDGRVRCAVCLGGSVLAQTVKLDSAKLWMGESNHYKAGMRVWDDPVTPRIYALDDFRSGDIDCGLEMMLGIDCPDNVQATVTMCEYEDDPVEFKSRLRWIAKHLAERGL